MIRCEIKTFHRRISDKWSVLDFRRSRSVASRLTSSDSRFRHWLFGRRKKLGFDVNESDIREARLFEKAFNPNLENVFGEISKHRISESRGHWLTLGLTRNARLPLHGIAQAREARTANGIAGAAWLLIWRDKELLPRGNERLAFVKYRKSLANQFYVLVANRWIVFFSAASRCFVLSPHRHADWPIRSPQPAQTAGSRS